MRVALYARVSTKDKGQTNDNQLRELRAFAKRLGYIIHKEYCDQESGGSAERPQFQQLLLDAHQRLGTKGGVITPTFGGLEGVFDAKRKIKPPQLPDHLTLSCDSTRRRRRPSRVKACANASSKRLMRRARAG